MCIERRQHLCCSPPLEATVLIQSLLNFTRIFDVMITRSSLNMGKVRLQTRSPGYISSKPSSPSRSHNFASVFMKLYQNVCLDDISVKFEYELCQVNN